MKPEFIDKLTGAEIVKIRMWLDIAVEGGERFSGICPFTNHWIREFMPYSGFTFNDFMFAEGSTQCDICEEFNDKYPDNTKYRHDFHRNNCPCRMFFSTRDLIKAVSEQLYNHRCLITRRVNKFRNECDERKR